MPGLVPGTHVFVRQRRARPPGCWAADLLHGDRVSGGDLAALDDFGINPHQIVPKAALQRSRYRQAAQCYLAAGDKAKADFSFVRAAGAESVVTKRQLATNARQVKQQFRQLREAFASH